MPVLKTAVTQKVSGQWSMILYAVHPLENILHLCYPVLSQTITTFGSTIRTFSDYKLFACEYPDFKSKKVSCHKMLTLFENSISVGRSDLRSAFSFVDAFKLVDIFNHITRDCCDIRQEIKKVS